MAQFTASKRVSSCIDHLVPSHVNETNFRQQKYIEQSLAMPYAQKQQQQPQSQNNDR